MNQASSFYGEKQDNRENNNSNNSNNLSTIDSVNINYSRPDQGNNTSSFGSIYHPPLSTAPHKSSMTIMDTGIALGAMKQNKI